MQLTAKVLKDKQSFVLTVSGDMDFNQIKTFNKAVREGLTAGCKKFIFNLKAVEFMDSSALGCLLYNQKLITDHSGSVTIIPNSIVLDLLHLTHLTDYFNLATADSVS